MQRNHPVIPAHPIDTGGPFASFGQFGGPSPANGTPPIRRPRTGRSAADRDQDVVVVGVDVGRVQAVLWLVTGALIAMDLLVSVAAGLNLLPYTITRFFDGDAKMNFPTGAKTTLLLMSTVLMLGCWTAGRRRGSPTARGWLMLALVTAFAFVDETTYLHQTLSETLGDHFHFHGVLKFAWTIVYFPAAVLVGAFLVRHLRQMRPQVRNRLLPGGGIYAVGALCFEPVKSHIADSIGDGSMVFRLVAVMSDSMELAGLALLVCALLQAARILTAGFSFALNPGPGIPRQAGTAPGALDVRSIEVRAIDDPSIGSRTFI
jgi:hypothetical protein